MPDAKLIRRFEFTCTSMTRSAPRKGHFVKGQKIIMLENDPRISWFRSGGFQEKVLTPIPDPIAVATKAGNDTASDESDGQAESSQYIELTELDKIDGIPKTPLNIVELLKKEKIKTVADVFAIKEEGLLKIKGIGEATAKTVIAACEAFLATKAGNDTEE